MQRLRYFTENIGVILLLTAIKGIFSQTFLRSCNNPAVEPMHTMVFGHTFCYHSCGYDLSVVPPVGFETCNAAGVCLCNYFCDGAPPALQFGDQCPSYTTDPLDTDPTAIPRCVATCAGICPGGVGQICGEVYGGPIPGTTNSYAKVCTCYCPPQPCTTTTTTTTSTTTTTTTTTTPPTTTTTQTAVVIVKKPVIVPFKIKLKLFKVYKACVLLIKLCALWTLKVTFWCLYCWFLEDWIDPLRRGAWEGLAWIWEGVEWGSRVWG